MFEGPRELNSSSSEIVCEESKKWWLRKGTTARRFAYKKDELKRRRNIRSTTNKQTLSCFDWKGRILAANNTSIP